MTVLQRDRLLACLRAAADGPFFPDWEFQTLFGVTREDVRGVATGWPNVDDTNEMVRLAITNSLANLIGYPHGRDDELLAQVGLHREELPALLEEWRSSFAAG